MFDKEMQRWVWPFPNGEIVAHDNDIEYEQRMEFIAIESVKWFNWLNANFPD